MTDKNTHIENNEGCELKSWQTLVDFFYKNSPAAREILLEHSNAVAQLALRINETKHVGLDPKQVEYAAMVHDIGIFLTHAPGIGCEGKEPYIKHGVLGADLLRKSGAPEWAARVAERHTGAGLSPKDIEEQNLPLPEDITLMPETLLEKLICYADKFFSKRPGALTEPKSLDKVRGEMSRFGADTLQRFESMHAIFKLIN